MIEINDRLIVINDQASVIEEKGGLPLNVNGAYLVLFDDQITINNQRKVFRCICRDAAGKMNDKKGKLHLAHAICFRSNSIIKDVQNTVQQLLRQQTQIIKEKIEADRSFNGMVWQLKKKNFFFRKAPNDFEDDDEELSKILYGSADGKDNNTKYNMNK